MYGPTNIEHIDLGRHAGRHTYSVGCTFTPGCRTEAEVSSEIAAEVTVTGSDTVAAAVRAAGLVPGPDDPGCDCTRRSDHTLKCASGLSVGVRLVNRLGELVDLETNVEDREDDAEWTADYRPPPTHYDAGGGLDPWKVWDAFDLDRYTANAVKYLLRAGKKDIAPRLDDLKKARDYVNKAIEREESRNESSTEGSG
jgi:hypothetical protein